MAARPPSVAAAKGIKAQFLPAFGNLHMTLLFRS